MHIRMYNCYFGDCFKIENSNGNDLLVDFGIHTTSTSTGNRLKRYNDIYNDIKGKKIDFLLSHYHEDHYNGAVYVNNNYGYKFEDVYIPDIWNIANSIQAVSLHLLQLIFDRYTLDRSTTIFSFLDNICNKRCKIHFVQRGSIIQEQYVALWPSEEHINDSALKLMIEVSEGHDISASDRERLTYFSSELREIVLILGSGDYLTEAMSARINSLEREFWNHEWGEDLNSPSFRDGVELEKFGNNISIVFQNMKDKYSDNLLFTGDFGNRKGLWKKIERNFDKNSACKMHSLYHVIKVGHHGTRRYHHSFVGRINSNSNLLIPNDGKKMNWNICSDYSLNAITKKARVICSTHNACEARNCTGGMCTCTNKVIIDPGVYFDIY